MSRGKSDHDHAPDEALPEPEPIAEPAAESPAPEPADPSINPPPEPAAAIPDDARHLLIVLEGLVSGLAALANQVPGAHTFGTRLIAARASLDALTAMAQNAK